jgi:hypothetical protein
MTPMDVLASQSLPIKAWLIWMFLVNVSSLIFIKHKFARWVAAAMLANMIAMNLLLRFYGPGEHISIPHIIIWTPLMVYLALVRDKWMQMSPLGVWVSLLVVTDVVSLAMDYWQIVCWIVN